MSWGYRNRNRVRPSKGPAVPQHIRDAATNNVGKMLHVLEAHLHKQAEPVIVDWVDKVTRPHMAAFNSLPAFMQIVRYNRIYFTLKVANVTVGLGRPYDFPNGVLFRPPSDGNGVVIDASDCDPGILRRLIPIAQEMDDTRKKATFLQGAVNKLCDTAHTPAQCVKLWPEFRLLMNNARETGYTVNATTVGDGGRPTPEMWAAIDRPAVAQWTLVLMDLQMRCAVIGEK